jgi:hypothetical protein
MFKWYVVYKFAGGEDHGTGASTIDAGTNVLNDDLMMDFIDAIKKDHPEFKQVVIINVLSLA